MNALRFKSFSNEFFKSVIVIFSYEIEGSISVFSHHSSGHGCIVTKSFGDCQRMPCEIFLFETFF